MPIARGIQSQPPRIRKASKKGSFEKPASSYSMFALSESMHTANPDFETTLNHVDSYMY